MEAALDEERQIAEIEVEARAGVEPEVRLRVEAVGNVVVREKPVAPAVGDAAVPSDTPTLANATIARASGIPTSRAIIVFVPAVGLSRERNTRAMESSRWVAANASMAWTSLNA